MEIKGNNIDISNLSLSQDYKSLYDDACTIIEDARQYAYRAVNVSLTIRNWLLGERIAKDKLDGAVKAEYGKGIIKVLAKELSSKYGKGLDFSSLYQYIRFYRLFPEILDAVSPKSRTTNVKQQNRGILDAASPKMERGAAAGAHLLPWTHYRELIRVENAEARKWYEQEALREMWSTRTLHRNIASQYYFRLLQSAHKENVVNEMHRLTADMQHDKLEFIKNPVVAEFLGLQPNADFTETELERSITTIGLLLCEDTSSDIARYSVLHGSEQLFQVKYMPYLPTEEELRHEIEMQKEIFRQQQLENIKKDRSEI